MWILLIPLIIVEVVFWLALAFFAWRAFNAYKRKNWFGIAFWVGLISIPFAFYNYKHFEADQKEAARAAEIAGLSQTNLERPYPKLLEIYGQATEHELVIFLTVLKFDEVAVLQRPRQNQIYGQFVTLVPGCEGHGDELLEKWKKRGRFSAPTKQTKDCLVSEWKKVSANRSAIPAIEYRHGTDSTLVPSGTNWGDGAYELRKRTPDGYHLIDYWERPYITRPSWYGPWGYAYPANVDFKKYRQPKRLDFILKSLE